MYEQENKDVCHFCKKQMEEHEEQVHLFGHAEDSDEEIVILAAHDECFFNFLDNVK